VVFVSHSHGDHFDPVILSWQSTVKNIKYVFGWKAGKGDRAIDIPALRATKMLGGMEIFTVNDEHDDVPEVAYLVKVDGLSIYHSGDYMGPIDEYQDDMVSVEEGGNDRHRLHEQGQAGRIVETWCRFSHPRREPGIHVRRLRPGSRRKETSLAGDLPRKQGRPVDIFQMKPVPVSPGITWIVILRFFVATLVLMAVLFLAAGKLDWWEGRAYVIQGFIVLIISRTILIRKNPDLARERAEAGKKEDVKPWDRILMPLMSICLPLMAWIVSGLDERFGWSPDLPDGTQLIACC